MAKIRAIFYPSNIDHFPSIMRHSDIESLTAPIFHSSTVMFEGALFHVKNLEEK